MAGRHRIVRNTAKRLTSWFQFSPVLTTITSSHLIFSLNAAALALRPFTVVRTRFLVDITTDNISGDERQVGGMGIAVVSDQAVAIGVTAIPTPITDMGSDLWFVHQLMYNRHEFITGAGFQSRANREYEIDSKAMRKVDIGQNLVVVVELAGGVSDGFTSVVGGRMLVKVN